MFSKEFKEESNNFNPLTLVDHQSIEDTDFSNVDKHYIRLLAHCLGCFKNMAQGSSIGSLPSPAVQLKWLRMHDQSFIDESFLYTLLEQFGSAANQLERIANHYEISPLELTLDYLINFSKDVENS